MPCHPPIPMRTSRGDWTRRAGVQVTGAMLGQGAAVQLQSPFRGRGRRATATVGSCRSLLVQSWLWRNAQHPARATAPRVVPQTAPSAVTAHRAVVATRRMATTRRRGRLTRLRRFRRRHGIRATPVVGPAAEAEDRVVRADPAGRPCPTRRSSTAPSIPCTSTS